jgi:hypothetical protein
MDEEEIKEIKAIKAIKEELEIFIPRQRESIDYCARQEVKECLEDMRMHGVDPQDVYKLFEWTQERKKDARDGDYLYHEAFADFENISSGIEMIKEGCSKIRKVLEYPPPSDLSTDQEKPNLEEVELEVHKQPEDTEMAKLLAEEAEKSLRMFKVDGEDELLEKLTEVEEAIKACKIEEAPEIGNPKHRPPDNLVNATIVALVDLLQEYFPPKKGAKVRLKACRYAGIFVYCAGLIDVDPENRFTLTIRKRYLASLNRTSNR